MLRIGHRGAPGNPRHGENTIASFRKAIWSGADAIELDVRQTRDGQLVVIHDLDVKRTTYGSGKICDMAYSEVYQLTAGSGERIPKLSDILDGFGKTCLINIEIKEAGIVEKAVKEAKFRRLHGRVLFSAFDYDDNDPDSSSSWEELARDSNGCAFALLATRRKIMSMGVGNYIDKAKDLGATAIHPEFNSIDPRMTFLASEVGLLVNAWTVNDFKDIEDIKRLGVNGICSDFPERL